MPSLNMEELYTLAVQNYKTIIKTQVNLRLFNDLQPHRFPAAPPLQMLEFREGRKKSKHTPPGGLSSSCSSPVCVFGVCSAGTSVVLVLLVTSLCAPISSSLSPADSSSEDSLQKRKGKNLSPDTGERSSQSDCKIPGENQRPCTESGGEN